MYVAWKYLHLLLFVFWIGTDVGVLLLARKFRDASLPVPSRVLLLQQALVIDTLPRICFVLMLPAGASLAASSGLVDIPGLYLGILWVAAFAWLGLGLTAAKNAETPRGPALQKAHWALLAVIGAGIAVAGLWLGAQGLPATAPWLAAKLVVYGLICFAAIGIDWAFGPIGPAVMKLMTEGSSPALEQTITASVNRALWFVYSLYGAVLLAAFIGVSRPFMG